MQVHRDFLISFAPFCFLREKAGEECLGLENHLSLPPFLSHSPEVLPFNNITTEVKDRQPPG